MDTHLRRLGEARKICGLHRDVAVRLWRWKPSWVNAWVVALFSSRRAASVGGMTYVVRPWQQFTKSRRSDPGRELESGFAVCEVLLDCPPSSNACRTSRSACEVRSWTSHLQRFSRHGGRFMVVTRACDSAVLLAASNSRMKSAPLGQSVCARFAGVTSRRRVAAPRSPQKIESPQAVRRRQRPSPHRIRVFSGEACRGLIFHDVTGSNTRDVRANRAELSHELRTPLAIFQATSRTCSITLICHHERVKPRDPAAHSPVAFAVEDLSSSPASRARTLNSSPHSRGLFGGHCG